MDPFVGYGQGVLPTEEAVQQASALFGRGPAHLSTEQKATVVAYYALDQYSQLTALRATHAATHDEFMALRATHAATHDELTALRATHAATLKALEFAELRADAAERKTARLGPQLSPISRLRLEHVPIFDGKGGGQAFRQLADEFELILAAEPVEMRPYILVALGTKLKDAPKTFYTMYAKNLATPDDVMSVLNALRKQYVIHSEKAEALTRLSTMVVPDWDEPALARLAETVRLAHGDSEETACHVFLSKLPDSLSIPRMSGALDGPTLAHCVVAASNALRRAIDERDTKAARRRLGAAVPPPPPHALSPAPTSVDDMVIGAVDGTGMAKGDKWAVQRAAWFKAGLCSRCGQKPGPATAACPRHWAGKPPKQGFLEGP